MVVTENSSRAHKVRVLFVNTRNRLGADVAVHLMLIRHFDPAEVEVHIAINRNALERDKMVAAMRDVPGLQPFVLDLGQEVAYSGGKLGKALGALRNVGLVPALLRLAWYVRRHRIDILHATDRPRDALVSTLLARLTGCANVVHLHIKWYAEIGRFTWMAVERCRGVIAISRFVRESLLAGGVPADKIYTVLNASEPDCFVPDTTPRGRLRSSLGLSAETPLIGIVARVILWKGHMELIEALALVRAVHPEVHLAIVGNEESGEAEDAEGFSAKLRRRIEELDLQHCIHWVGWRDDAPEVMADLDVVAVPSWEEPFGLVVTEAMAMQRPVVGFASGALPEIVTDGVEGLLVPSRDIPALARALIALLNDPALRAEMGCAGRARVLQQFTPERQAREMAEVYRRVLAGLPDAPDRLQRRF